MEAIFYLFVHYFCIIDGPPTQVDELKHMGQLKHGGRVKDQVMSVSLYHFLSYRNLFTCQINMQHLIVS